MNNQLIPNSFLYPNFYVDKLAHLLTPEENTVLTKAIREGHGIALSVFTEGKFKKVGPSGEPLPKTEENRLAYGCGLQKDVVHTALKNLVEFRVLILIGSPDGPLYELQIDPNQVDWGRVEKRKRGDK